MSCLSEPVKQRLTALRTFRHLLAQADEVLAECNPLTDGDLFKDAVFIAESAQADYDALQLGGILKPLKPEGATLCPKPAPRA
jgi:hypothetical protein